MSLIMGVYWTKTLSYYFMIALGVCETILADITYLLYFSEIGFGVFVFVVLIINRSTLTLLVDR